MFKESSLRILMKYFKTPHPYKNNFPARFILNQSSFLDRINIKRLERPWIKYNDQSKISHTNIASSYIGAVPHYRTGIGHILAEWNTGLLWSKKLALKFAHCPLREPWNDFFGLHGFDDFMTVCSKRKFKRILLPPISDKVEPSESDLIKKIIYHYTKKNPCIFQLYYGQNSYHHFDTTHTLRKKYFEKRVVDPILDCRAEGLVNVSVHIRRPTFEDSKQSEFQDRENSSYKARFIDLSFFSRICDKVSKILGRDRVCFNIFSLGSRDEFNELKKLKNVFYHLNEDVRQTFHNIVMGDILILSPSSFSFNAGIVSKGVKIAPAPWWHSIPQNDEWCPLKLESDCDDLRLFSFLKKLH